jgi:hypothetical protein
MSSPERHPSDAVLLGYRLRLGKHRRGLLDIATTVKRGSEIGKTRPTALSLGCAGSGRDVLDHRPELLGR